MSSVVCRVCGSILSPNHAPTAASWLATRRKIALGSRGAGAYRCAPPALVGGVAPACGSGCTGCSRSFWIHADLSRSISRFVCHCFFMAAWSSPWYDGITRRDWSAEASMLACVCAVAVDDSCSLVGVGCELVCLLVGLLVCLIVWREIHLWGLAYIGNCQKAKAARTTRSLFQYPSHQRALSSCCALLRNFDFPDYKSRRPGRRKIEKARKKQPCPCTLT